MEILFLHGWDSAPGGVKRPYLKDHGHEIIKPALDGNDFEAAEATAQAVFDQHQLQFVVRSSLGGTVAMSINIGEAKLALLFQAWKNWGTVNPEKPGTVILHSNANEIIPCGDSEELASNSGASLIEAGSDHRLANSKSFNMLESGNK